MKDYHAVIDVKVDAKTALRAIHEEMHIWWSTRVELGPETATIRFNDSYVIFDFEPALDENQFFWDCREAKMIIQGVPDEAEWKGTKLLWHVEEKDTGSRIALTHLGLNSGLECHDICVSGWERYFENSLKSHLNGRVASPEKSEG